jgi:glycosyltransferase involved in cell wall biosynthesis
MRILHLRASNFYGGPERQLCRHAELLHDKDHEVIVASFTENGARPALLDTANQRGVTTAEFPVRSAYDPAAVTELVNFVQKEQIRILCTHDYRSHILGHLARARTGLTHICFARGFTQENAKVRAFQLMDRLLMRFANRVVAVSEAQARYLRSWGVPSKKLSVVYNSISSEAFSDIRPVDLHARLDLPGEAIIAVAAGRFSREKGQRFLVRAITKAISQDERLHLVLFGEGADLPDIANWINAQGMSDHVHCPGYEHNLIGCLKGADMLINPSRSEGLPNIVLEAMAVRLPVVATKVGGVPELIEDGVSGWLIDYGDEAGLSGAVTKLAQDPSLREKFARAAEGVIRNRFSFERQAEELIRIYDQVAS